MHDFRAPPWLPGGNLQTIWPALFSRAYTGPRPLYRRERWATPDGDFIDVDHLADGTGPAATAPLPVNDSNAHTGARAPLLVLFHGLEGSSASGYALALAHQARARGWCFCVPHFRGCSGALNHAPRAYHSGDFEEVGWMLERLRAQHGAPLLAAGVSLGGNALLRWAEEAGASATHTVRALAAISAPVDLAAAGHAIDRGFNGLVYSRMFLRTMKPKALAKWQQHPGLFDRERLVRARTLFEFDNVFTAPLHGFADTPDYWARASAKPHLARIRVPTLVLNAQNDPFVPRASLPAAAAAGEHVTLWQPAQGGHVGFAETPFPGQIISWADVVMNWLHTSG